MKSVIGVGRSSVKQGERQFWTLTPVSDMSLEKQGHARIKHLPGPIRRTMTYRNSVTGTTIQ